MAESKGSLLAKSVQKHAGRAKEKILRNLGKVDQTADDIFDEHLQNFNQQQAISSRLQKEFNNYIRCVRAMQTASRSLIDVLGEIYESNWADRETFCSQLQNIEILLHDYGHKLADQVLIPMNTYQSQFPEMKKKIDKRGRKLVDYDSQRHNFQNIQQMGKKRDEVKILRAKEQLEEAKRTYELLNSELHDELPALYDSRILFTMTNLQTLFSTEQVFHSETAKLYAELEAIVDKLAMDNQRSPFIAKLKSNAANGGGDSAAASGATATTAAAATKTTTTKYDNQSSTMTTATTTTTMTTTTAAPVSNQTFLNANSNTQNNNNNNNNDVNHFGVTVPSDNNTTNTNNNKNNNNNIVNNNNVSETSGGNDDEDTSLFYTARSSKSDSKLADFDSNSSSKSSSSTTNAHSTKSIYCSFHGSDAKSTEDDLNDPAEDQQQQKQSNDDDGNRNNDDDNNRFSETSKKSPISTVQVPQDATTDGLPDGVYYKVKALFAYEKEDDDELSFETGEILQVIDYDDPDVQEDGWLMGIKESTCEKGMFPENFTKPI